MLLPPVAGCAAAEASPPPTIPTAGQALRRRQAHTAAEPVNPRTPLRTGFHCRVVPFLGLAVVHRRGALRAAWSTWSRNDFHRKSTIRGEADSWVHGHSQFFCDCQVSRFVRPVGLQIFQDEESFHSAGQENGPSVMRNGCTFLKHIKPAISFKYLFFISRF